jgi:hypothetical protein
MEGSMLDEARILASDIMTRDVAVVRSRDHAAGCGEADGFARS